MNEQTNVSPKFCSNTSTGSVMEPERHLRIKYVVSDIDQNLIS